MAVDTARHGEGFENCRTFLAGSYFNFNGKGAKRAMLVSKGTEPNENICLIIFKNRRTVR